MPDVEFDRDVFNAIGEAHWRIVHYASWEREGVYRVDRELAVALKTLVAEWAETWTEAAEPAREGAA